MLAYAFQAYRKEAEPQLRPQLIANPFAIRRMVGNTIPTAGVE